MLRNKPKRIIGECPSCRQTILNVNNKRSNDIDSTIIDFIQSGVIDNRDVVNDFFDNGGGEPFSVKEKVRFMLFPRDSLLLFTKLFFFQHLGRKKYYPIATMSFPLIHSIYLGMKVNQQVTSFIVLLTRIKALAVICPILCMVHLMIQLCYNFSYQDIPHVFSCELT